MSRKLYLIGNGFDIDHGFKTKYTDFRNWLCEQNDLNPNDDYSTDTWEIPVENEAVHGGPAFIEKDLAKFFLGIIDECTENNWNNFESCLGSKLVGFAKKWHMQEPDLEDDRHLFDGPLNNEEASNNFRNVVPELKRLFVEWVSDELCYIDYSNGKSKLGKYIDINGEYISFNYTKTLSEIYCVDSSKIHYIHGVCDEPDSIIVGHGDSHEYEIDENYYGSCGLDEAYECLYKDTEQIIINNRELFSSLNDIEEIYSLGFGFSDVDMKYVREIYRTINERIPLHINEISFNNIDEDTMNELNNYFIVDVI